MQNLSGVLGKIDEFVWGPVMLALLTGTGIFLTLKTRFLPWRNLGYALRKSFSRESMKKTGDGDISPFSALMTALAATIGTGNIVGVATAMVSGGPGALIWMCISAVFGLTSKFSECMLSTKYREVNEKGEMCGGPMYTMKKGIKIKKLGAILGWLFAFFAVIASFGIGNLTQANSISDALDSTFGIPVWITGVIATVIAFAIMVGGINTISKVSSVIVPAMAVFYIVAGLVVIICNLPALPEGIAMIFKMAFSAEAVGGGLCGTITASMMNAVRFGVARGVFSNEAGMGSAAITAAAATTDNNVRQGYVNMTGTFWDTIVVCTITGLCIACSGVLGMTEVDKSGTYIVQKVSDTDYDASMSISVADDNGNTVVNNYDVDIEGVAATLTGDGSVIELTALDTGGRRMLQGLSAESFVGTWTDEEGNHYVFGEDGTYSYKTVIVGAKLTILAFESAMGEIGGWFVAIGIVLFAFATIIGWEYNGEKALEYILGTHRFNKLYRIIFSLAVYVGATTALDIVWSFSDIANALMAVPNLICLLLLSGEIARDTKAFEVIKKREEAARKSRA